MCGRKPKISFGGSKVGLKYGAAADTEGLVSNLRFFLKKSEIKRVVGGLLGLGRNNVP